MTAEEKRLQALRYARIRRVKQLLKWLPRRSNLERYMVLKWFAKAARRRPYLWSFKTPQCTPAFYAGAIIAFLPFYGIQLVMAFAAAVVLRANLPITCGLLILTNPISAIPVYVFTYKIGRSVMNFFNYGEGQTLVATQFNALIIGGIIVGAVVGGVLDLLYRLAAYEGRKLSRSRQRPAGKRELAAPLSPPPVESTLRPQEAEEAERLLR